MPEFKHFTVLGDGHAGELKAGFECLQGHAVMAMNMWAVDPEQAADMFIHIGREIGFKVSQEIEVYDTEADRPASDSPFAYDIQFAPFETA